MTRTNTNIQTNTKTHRTPRHNRHLEKKTIFVFVALLGIIVFTNALQNDMVVSFGKNLRKYQFSISCFVSHNLYNDS